MKKNIVLNGKNGTVEWGTSIENLLIEQGLHGRRLAVEVNEKIIPKSQHAEYELNDGDTVEIVHAIGGGWAK